MEVIGLLGVLLLLATMLGYPAAGVSTGACRRHAQELALRLDVFERLQRC
jgi:hypothetical protein